MSTLVPALETPTPRLAPTQQRRPADRAAHVVQFYKENELLLDSLSGLVAPALSHGDVAGKRNIGVNGTSERR